MLFKNKRSNIIIGLVTLWILYFVYFLALKDHINYTKEISIITTIFDPILDLAIAVFSILICLKTNNNFVKIIFALLFVAFVFDATSDLLYNYDMYILQLQYTEVNIITGSLYNIPYLITLILEFAMLSLLLNYLYKKNGQIQLKSNLLSYIPFYVLLITVILTILFEYKNLAIQAKQAPILLYDFFQFMFYITNITLLLLCAPIIRNKNIFLIVCGYIIYFAASIGIYFDIIPSPLGTKNILELVWTLGNFFIAYGMYDYHKNLNKISEDTLL